MFPNPMNPIVLGWGWGVPGLEYGSCSRKVAAIVRGVSAPLGVWERLRCIVLWDVVV